VALGTVAAAVIAAGATASTQPRFAFGVTGGFVIPYTVTIAADGAVSATRATVKRRRLGPKQLATLRALARQVGFAAMPQTTLCDGVLPDVASSFIHVGPRVVVVHGDCVPGFNQLLSALRHAVGMAP
jgi:hypothetical protein